MTRYLALEVKVVPEYVEHLARQFSDDIWRLVFLGLAQSQSGADRKEQTANTEHGEQLHHAHYEQFEYSTGTDAEHCMNQNIKPGIVWASC